MKLKLFHFVDSCVQSYENNADLYHQVNLILIDYFTKHYQSKFEYITSVYTRIKSPNSLREKLFRNKYYLNYTTENEVLDAIPDIIGATLECRFNKDEPRIYNALIKDYRKKDNELYQSVYDENLYLNVSEKQPQTQKNGFPIYRIDGFYIKDGYKVNFELQIKAMVHSFWGEIEHQLVYKNKKLRFYSDISEKMLSSIRENLDVIDRQLEIIYKQMEDEGHSNRSVEMSPEYLKMMIASGINEIVSQNMMKSIKVVTNFKECSALLSQFIYVHYFLKEKNNEYQIFEYLSHLNQLRLSDLDFSQEIELQSYFSEDVFCNKLGNYWVKLMNIDYEWHVFFIMCFAIQKENIEVSFDKFLITIKNLLLPQHMINEYFGNKSYRDVLLKEVEASLANAMIQSNSLKIVYEKHLIDIATILKGILEEMSHQYKSQEDVLKDKENINQLIQRSVLNVL